MKTIFLLMAFWLSAGVAMAASFPELGVLLTTPEEREKIALLRRVPERELPEADQALPGLFPEAATPESAPAPPTTVTLHGLTKRGDGSSVAWINRGHTLYSTTLPSGVEFLSPLDNATAARLRLSATAEELLLRVGQTRLVAEGVTVDFYRRPPESVTGASLAEMGEVSAATTIPQPEQASTP